MAGFFPLYFKQYWNAGVEATESTFRLGLANGIGSLIIAVLAPLVGAIADKGGARIKLLALFTVLGAAMTVGCTGSRKGDWMLAAVLYVVASLGFWHGNQFYDSLLTDVRRRAGLRPRLRLRLLARLSRRRPAVPRQRAHGDEARDVRHRGCERGRAAFVHHGGRLVGRVHDSRCCS